MGLLLLVLVSTGNGFTVTATVLLAEQLPNVTVTEYVPLMAVVAEAFTTGLWSAEAKNGPDHRYDALGVVFTLS